MHISLDVHCIGIDPFISGDFTREKQEHLFVLRQDGSLVVVVLDMGKGGNNQRTRVDITIRRNWDAKFDVVVKLSLTLPLSMALFAL